MDVLGPIKKFISNLCYGFGVIYEYTVYEDILIMSNWGQVYDAICEYMARTEPVTGHKLQRIWLDGAGEHKEEIVSQFIQVQGIILESWTPCTTK